MQFRDLKEQYRVLKDEIDAAMLDVAASGAFINGPQVAELEQQLADYVGVKHCITCANGTEALTLALKTWGVGSGDCVFVPDFTFFASSEVVSLEGATPVFVDVDASTFNISPRDLEEKVRAVIAEGRLTPKAVIAVDLFGLPAEYPALRAIADKYGLLLLEDGAQGFGGTIAKRRNCSFGDIGTTSFFPAKPLGCYGDGGAVFTNNDDWADLVRSYRVHGKGSYKYDNVRIGLNSRLDTMQAAILLVKLKAFVEYELAAVNTVAQKYTARLHDLVTTPQLPAGYTSAWAQYTIRLGNATQRNELQARLKAAGIPTMIYYPIAMHQQTANLSSVRPAVSCPTTTELCDTVLSLPMHPYLTDSDIDKICNAVKSSMEEI